MIETTQAFGERVIRELQELRDSLANGERVEATFVVRTVTAAELRREDDE